jgi:phosphoribosylanthranilate isomerase
MTLIKICGIKREDEVAIINEFPVSYAGFIFAPSKRQVDASRCKDLAQNLRKDIKKVGVFVNEPIDSLRSIIDECKLDVVQLHGDETVDYIRKICIPVWKTIPVRDEDSVFNAAAYEDDVEGILFETFHEKLRGGTGETFDWNIFKRVEEEKKLHQVLTTHPVKNYKTILAGGINPENIKKALFIVEPDIVDVNSGVEVNGFKTIERVKTLFEAIQATNHEIKT